MTAEREPWRRTKEGVVVSCRLTPKGGRDAIDGVAQLADGSSVLAARVRTAPQGGEANQALCVLLAKRLDVPASGARIVAGSKSRLKQVAVSGDPATLIARTRGAVGEPLRPVGAVLSDAADAGLSAPKPALHCSAVPVDELRDAVLMGRARRVRVHKRASECQVWFSSTTRWSWPFVASQTWVRSSIV